MYWISFITVYWFAYSSSFNRKAKIVSVFALYIGFNLQLLKPWFQFLGPCQIREAFFPLWQLVKLPGEADLPWLSMWVAIKYRSEHLRNFLPAYRCEATISAQLEAEASWILSDTRLPSKKDSSKHDAASALRGKFLACTTSSSIWFEYLLVFNFPAAGPLRVDSFRVRHVVGSQTERFLWKRQRRHKGIKSQRGATRANSYQSARWISQCQDVHWSIEPQSAESENIFSLWFSSLPALSRCYFLISADVFIDFSCCPLATDCLRDGVLVEHGTVSQYLSTKMGTKDFGSDFDKVQEA